MPKVTIRIGGSQEEAHRALNLIPICIFTLTGIEVNLTSKSVPDVLELQFFLVSIDVKDPRALHSVKSLNQDMPLGMTP